MSEPLRQYALIDLDGLARAEGRYLLDGATAVLKGALESEIEIGGLVIDRGWRFESAFRAAQEREITEVLHRNRMRLLRRRTPERRLVEAGRLAQAGGGDTAALAVIQNEEVPRAVAALERGGEEARSGTILLVVDAPERHPGITICPLLAGLGIPVLQPRDLASLRDSVEYAAELARGHDSPTAIVADESLFRSIETLEVRANRVVETVDVAAALRRRRVTRSTERGDLLRIARRLELDRITAMPSPGEVEPLGLVTTGVASTAVTHLLEELRLTGRVPTLHMGMVTPCDPAAIERMLLRCRLLVLVETRPGQLAGPVLEIAEGLRRRGEQVAELAWRVLPGDAEETLEPGDAGRSSILGRRLLHLLQPVRPTLRVEDRFADIESADLPEVPPRRARRERTRLLSVVRRGVVAADRDLQRGDEDNEPLALAINGRQPAGFAGKVVAIELLDRRDLLQQVVPLVGARSDRPWVLVIVDDGTREDLDAERILSAAVPAGLPDPPTVQRVAFRGEAELRNQIKIAARAGEPSILVTRRSIEPGMEGSNVEEIDRLGYAPLVRVQVAIDEAAGVRRQAFAVENRTLPSPSEIVAKFNVEPAQRRLAGRWFLRIRRLVEIAEIVRARPPLPRSPVHAGQEIREPVIKHSNRGLWRAHVAGVRGSGQGAAATALALAGREMGFDVRVIHQPESIGDGRTAWSQVLFTRPRSGESPPSMTAAIPYGEADLLLGVDPVETIRALGPDPNLRVAQPGNTAMVGNLELLLDQRDEGIRDVAGQLRVLAGRCCGTSSDYLSELAGVVTRQFRNERLLDMVLLGIAYQRGTVPVSQGAMREALLRIEASGFGRSEEAFNFGRELGLEERQPRPVDPPRDAEANLREVLREFRFSRGSRRSSSLRKRLRASLDRMPGLMETEAGREAAVDFVQAAAALFRWGGQRSVERLIERVESIYRVDRGDTGRELTRTAILPLAEVMLSRDLPYFAAVAIGLAHRRHIRRRLGVRTGRGDHLEVVYLIRGDLVLFRRRIRVELPAKAWLLRLLAAIGRRLPLRMRGSAMDRRRRSVVLAMVDAAISEAGDTGRYREWCHRLAKLHRFAEEGRLHEVPLRELDPGITATE
ncbi:MAG: hypothetical protein MK085_03050 [Phycisphaerales bacterium]|nr:hypothetical protein [Phycisphaerales bacterium]